MNGTIPHPLIVLGATGTIGERVVARAIAGGRRTIGVARDAGALARLHAMHGERLVPIVADIASDADAAALAAQLRRMPGPPPGAVVAAIRGTPDAGRVLDAPADFLRRRLDEDLIPHLVVARHLLPLLAAQPRAGYVLVGGPGAAQPWAGYGHHSIGAAALRMLARVLHEEARSLPVRVQMLVVDSPVRSAANAVHACTRWPDADDVAAHALRLADGAVPGDAAVVRFPLGAVARPPGLSDDLDIAPPPCTPPGPSRAAHTHHDDARALLRRIAADLPSPQEFRP